MSVVVEGRCGIRAEIIQDSVNAYTDERIITFLLDYPRFVHAEMMTHRVYSRNAASSRAIPVERMIQAIEQQAAEPVWWGKNQPGMQAKEEFTGGDRELARQIWHRAKKDAITHAMTLHTLGVHKQIVNRLLEPFQIYRAVFTATDRKNFYALRRHPDAQPEVRELAECMYQAEQMSVPVEVGDGQWHVPFVERRIEDGEMHYFDENGTEITFEEAIRISASCCAQTSYRRNDQSLEKANAIYDRLVESKPVHASPFEHQARPMLYDFDELVTHTDVWGNLWSGNFRGWGQNRQQIADHVVEG